MSRTGKLIKDSRELSQVTQKELAEKMGVSDMFISRIEAGLSPLPPKYIPQVADALRITKSIVVSALRQDVVEKFDERISQYIK